MGANPSLRRECAFANFRPPAISTSELHPPIWLHKFTTISSIHTKYQKGINSPLSHYRHRIDFPFFRPLLLHPQINKMQTARQSLQLQKQTTMVSRYVTDPRRLHYSLHALFSTYFWLPSPLTHRPSPSSLPLSLSQTQNHHHSSSRFHPSSQSSRQCSVTQRRHSSTKATNQPSCYLWLCRLC